MAAPKPSAYQGHTLRTPASTNPSEHRSFFADAVQLILDELATTLTSFQPTQMKAAVRLIAGNQRICTLGHGRTGLALRMGGAQLATFGKLLTEWDEGGPPTEGLLLIASPQGDEPALCEVIQAAKREGVSTLILTANLESHAALAADAAVLLTTPS